MLHDIVKKGSVDRSVTVKIIDSTDGTPETGVVFNTSGIDLWYRREGAAKTSITEATLAALTTAHSDGGFLHISDGVYRLDLPDAAFATGANYVDFGGTVTGMIVIGGRVRLIDADFEAAILTDSEIALAVWAATTRRLSDATNITSTGGTTVPQTGDAYARLGAPAGASTAADVAAVKSDTAAILADTGTDGVVVAAASKTGYTLSSAGIQAIWDALTSALTTVGSIGKLLVDNINATISSRLATAGYTAPPSAADNADAVWDEATSGHQTAGTTGKALTDAGAAGTPATAAEIADAVWDETLSGHLTSGTTGNALNAAGAAGDPWTTTLPGAYGAGTAGKIIGDNLNATVGSRATQTSVDTVDDFLDTEIAAIKAKTDNLPTDPADQSAVEAAITAAQLTEAGVRTAVGIASANLDTQLAKLDTIDDFLDTEIAAIKAKTDNLPTDPADASDIAASFATVTSTLATIAAYVDTEVAAIKTVTDQLAAAQAEPSAVPAANATPLEKIAWLAALARNKVIQTSTTQTLRDDADTVDIATATVSDDGTTFERSQWV